MKCCPRAVGHIPFHAERCDTYLLAGQPSPWGALGGGGGVTPSGPEFSDSLRVSLSLHGASSPSSACPLPQSWNLYPHLRPSAPRPPGPTSTRMQEAPAAMPLPLCPPSSLITRALGPCACGVCCDSPPPLLPLATPPWTFTRSTSLQALWFPKSKDAHSPCPPGTYSYDPGREGRLP